MKNKLSKFLALALGLVLIVSMLPAVSANNDQLRNMIVGQTQKYMDVTYTINSRVARKDISDVPERMAAYHEGGILPIAYFEYNRIKFPIKGVMMDANGGTYEAFVASIDNTVNKIEKAHTVDLDGKTPKYGDIAGPLATAGVTPMAPYVGFDMNSFLVDLVSRVTPNAPVSVKEALTSDALVALMDGANLSAINSKSAIQDNAAAKAAYGKMQKGDLLLAWDNEAKAAEAAKIHVMVVKEVAGDQVTVMYPAYSQPVYTFRCDKCGALDYEGPTSAATPNHITSNSYYRFKNLHSHKELDPTTSCKGRWQCVTATTWRTETVSHDDLLTKGVPYGSAGYLPYTLAAYTNGSPDVSVKGTSNVNASTITGGFTAKVSSNYRIIAFEAVLTADNGTVQRFPSFANGWKNWEYDYSDPALDLALMDSKPGKYKLDLYVQSGPADANGVVGSSLAYTMEFELAGAAVKLTADKTFAAQGETVTVSLNAQKEGMTALKTTVSYDAKVLEFDVNASKKASPNVTFTDNGVDAVAIRYAGPALKANTVPVKLYFTAKRTGDRAVKAEDVIPFKMLELDTATVANATDAQLEPDRADGLSHLAVGYNTLLYKNYVGDNDLLLVFFSDNEVALYKETTLPMLYDGKLMEEVTQAHYLLDGVPWLMCFGHIGPNLDPALVSEDESESPTMSPEIVYWAEANLDVNESGFTDISDAQMIANIYNGKVPLEGNVIKWLRADVNRDGKVDVKDRNQLLDSLFN